MKAREGGEKYKEGHVDFKKEYIHWEVTKQEDDGSSVRVDESKTDEKEKSEEYSVKINHEGKPLP